MKVLITLTDVEPAVRLNALLEQEGIETAVVSPLDDMAAMIARERPDAIVFTGALLDQGNVHTVRRMLWDGVPSIGFADVLDPATSERLRAIGYAEIHAKPVALDDAVSGVRRILDRQRLARVTGLIGDSDAIREVLVKVEQMAPVSSTVLIEGESGTGKELVARAIHRLSPRRARPFIAVNVGALPESLLESELFGHEKGAFTGAAERRIGRFELADTGTLFLDEIGEIPPATQVRLLRVLEERELTRVGGTQAIEVDVRVVAATNQPLRELVERGIFRSDLYYRLNVLHIYLPPLRDRREDIPILVRRFVSELSRQHDRPFLGISAEAMQRLQDYGWPGNVRELRNLVESMVVLAPGREIGAEDIPREIREGGSRRFLPVPVSAAVRERTSAEGREFEFIVRSLVELKLQVEELRRRLDEERAVQAAWHAAGGGPTSPAALGAVGGGAAGRGEGEGEVRPGYAAAGELGAGEVGRIDGGGVAPPAGAIEPRDQPRPLDTVTIVPGMTMMEIERAAIENALRATRGNRRKAAEMLGIGERTLYRKLREYRVPLGDLVLD